MHPAIVCFDEPRSSVLNLACVSGDSSSATGLVRCLNAAAELEKATGGRGNGEDGTSGRSSNSGGGKTPNFPSSPLASSSSSPSTLSLIPTDEAVSRAIIAIASSAARSAVKEEVTLIHTLSDEAASTLRLIDTRTSQLTRMQEDMSKVHTDLVGSVSSVVSSNVMAAVQTDVHQVIDGKMNKMGEAVASELARMQVVCEGTSQSCEVTRKDIFLLAKLVGDECGYVISSRPTPLPGHGHTHTPHDLIFSSSPVISSSSSSRAAAASPLHPPLTSSVGPSLVIMPGGGAGAGGAASAGSVGGGSRAQQVNISIANLRTAVSRQCSEFSFTLFVNLLAC